MRCAVEGLGGEASSEAEIALRVSGGPRMGRTAELGCGPCTDRVSLGPGEDLGAVESWRSSTISGCGVTTELSPLVVSSTSSRFGDFFLSRTTVE